jgi:hypothetical protein
LAPNTEFAPNNSSWRWRERPQSRRAARSGFRVSATFLSLCGFRVQQQGPMGFVLFDDSMLGLLAPGGGVSGGCTIAEPCPNCPKLLPRLLLSVTFSHMPTPCTWCRRDAVGCFSLTPWCANCGIRNSPHCAYHPGVCVSAMLTTSWFLGCCAYGRRPRSRRCPFHALFRVRGEPRQYAQSWGLGACSRVRVDSGVPQPFLALAVGCLCTRLFVRTCSN